MHSLFAGARQIWQPTSPKSSSIIAGPCGAFSRESIPPRAATATAQRVDGTLWTQGADSDGFAGVECHAKPTAK